MVVVDQQDGLHAARRTLSNPRLENKLLDWIEDRETRVEMAVIDVRRDEL
jgi:hypothetical protein